MGYCQRAPAAESNVVLPPGVARGFAMQAASPHALFIRQIETVSRLDEDDRRAIGSLPLRTRRMDENAEVFREGQISTESCLIVQGILCRYKYVVGGRQILSFHFTGDVPDLQSMLLPKMDHTLAALTPVVLGFIPHSALIAATLERPNLAAAFHRQALIDGSIFREWIANIGRRTAIQRVAHVICECFHRMRALGLTTQHTFELPITQNEFGDATGLSVVHINRTLQALRHEGLVTSQGKKLTINDWPALRKKADFDPAYLHMLEPVAA